MTLHSTGARRRTTWTAVVAILLQAIVSAWHVHGDGLGERSTAAQWAGPGVGRAVEAPTAPAPAPQPGKADHDDCAICFALHLATTAPLPTTVAFACPAAMDAEYIPSGVTFDLPAAPYRLFNTRAPPLVATGHAFV